MNKAICSAVSLALLALSATAQADDYYIVTPMDQSASSSSSESESSSLIATLNETTLPVAYVNEAYSYDMKQLLVVVGDSELDLSQSTWEAVGALPDGMTLGTNGVFSGTPTSASPSEGTPFTVRATYKTASDEQVYYLQINFPVSVALASATLPTAQVGVAYSYDFKQLMDIISDPNENPSLAEFSAVTALPDGLSLGLDGVLSGTPTQDSAGASFTIRVTYKTAMAEHTYSQTVTLPIAVALAEATLPAAQVGQAYTYDMAPLVTISNDSDPQPTQVSFEAASALPAGLTLATNGTLSGTPTTADPAASFTVMVTYKTAAAQRTYLLDVKIPIVVNLSTAIPAATAGTTYSYDLKQNLTVTGDESVDLSQSSWSTTTSLPPWLTLSPEGILSGTPSIQADAQGSLAVTAAYKTASDSKVITLVVNGVVLRATQVIAGLQHTCAIRADDAGVSCWGANSAGQLGNGTTVASTKPVTVTGLSNVIKLASSGYGQHTCALISDGAVKCWGGNNGGQLGDGSTTHRTTPVQVVGLTSGVVDIAAAALHTCAVKGAAALCWGYNNVGQLGTNNTTSYSTPQFVSGLSTSTKKVGTGTAHSCAVTTSNGVVCWGQNTSGQVGDGTTTNRKTPVNVSGLTSGVSSITLGEYFSCAITTAGAAKCWGTNGFSELGTGVVISKRTSPVGVSGLSSGVVAMAAGGRGACAVTTAGAVKCWGNNQYGQIGDGTTTTRSTPVNVSGITSGAVAVGLGDLHACAVLNTGETRCWGYNSGGQVGDGTSSNTRPVPVTVKNP